MTIPVIWVSRSTAILSRGYADQGFWDAMLGGVIWTPPGAFAFEHFVDVGRPGSPDPEVFPAVAGAVVVVPARHHTSPEDVSWLLAQLDRLSWYLVLVSGDEEAAFPWQRIPRTERRKVWVMQPRPEHAGRVDGMLPGGWYPGTREAITAHAPTDGRRALDWFFGGQVTHSRRQECAAVLRGLHLDRPQRSALIETDGYMRGVEQRSYMALLARAKVVPCPSGPYTVDTARPLEAMEAGCVPVVDTLTPRGDDWDYWALVFGPDCPLTRIRDWEAFPHILADELADWPGDSNRVFAFWQQWKRRTVQHLHDDIASASGIPLVAAGPDAQITVLIPTSPAPLHPSTAHLEETVAAVRAQLPHAEIVIAADGVRPELAEWASDYAEYLRRVLWLCNYEWHNVVPFVAGEWLHQAELTRRALDFVRTPLVLFIEHDRPPTGEIDWEGLCAVVASGRIDQARLHPEVEVHPDQAHLMLGPPALIGGVPLQRTAAWWQHPHLCRTDWYRSALTDHFPPGSRTFIEDRLYQLAESDFFDHGLSSWQRWKLAIYAPEGMRRSYHLDSRGDAPKGDIWWTPAENDAGVPA